MCDFKVGDEVVCIVEHGWFTSAPAWMFWRKFRPSRDAPQKGGVYVVARVAKAPRVDNGCPDVFVELKSKPAAYWQANCFRKVQRRDLSEWLETSVPNTDKLDKSHRAKKREHV